MLVAGGNHTIAFTVISNSLRDADADYLPKAIHRRSSTCTSFRAEFRTEEGKPFRCYGVLMKLAATIIAMTLTFAGSQIAMSQVAKAADINAISGGAFKQVLTALVAQYEQESGNKVNVTYQTVGQHLKLIASGEEAFEVRC